MRVKPITEREFFQITESLNYMHNFIQSYKAQHPHALAQEIATAWEKEHNTHPQK
jgi:hypothetical protein